MSGYVPRKLRDRSGSTAKRGKGSRDLRVEADKPAAAKKPRPAGGRKSGKRRPAPGSGPRRPSPKARTTLKSYRRPARTIGEWRGLARKLGLAAVVSVLLAGLAWVASGETGLQLAGVFGRSTEVVDEAKKDARTAVSAMLSYDYRNFDDAITNAEAHITGPYKAEYLKFQKGLEKTVKDEKATVEAEVMEVATVEANATCSPKKGPSVDGIEFLTFVDQIVKNKNINGSRVDKSRVAICVTETDEGWKVADLDAM